MACLQGVRGLVSVMIGLVGAWVSLDAQQSRDTAPVPAKLERGTAVLAGTIVSDDESARPIRRAQVTVAPDGASMSGRTAVTNDAGQFVVTGLPAGRYLVTATKGAYLGAAYGATRTPRPGAAPSGTAVAIGEGQRISNLVLRMMRGAVITGTITDEAGRPARDVSLNVSYRTRSPQTGRPVLTRVSGALGSGRTDSRGSYRLYGLPPGEYIVWATAGGPFMSTFDLTLTTDADVARATDTTGQTSQTPDHQPRPRVGFVPVYFPGTITADEATLVRVAGGEERAGINFSLRLVPNARVDGIVTAVDGGPAANAQLLAHRDGGPGERIAVATARTDPQGRFSLRGIPPGAYTITAVAGTTAWGAASVSVHGDDTRTNIQLRPSVTISGSLSADASATLPAPDFSRIRIRLVVESSDGPISGSGLNVPVAADGTFNIALLPGRYRVQLAAPAFDGAHWIVHTAAIGNQNVADAAFELGDGSQKLTATVTLTNQAAQISGRMIDAAGQPAPEYFVILFPESPALWGWQARRIAQARPGHDGTFAFNGLPPGDYLLAAVTDVDQNEWFDPEFLKSLTGAAIRLSVAAGETKQQTIQVK